MRILFLQNSTRLEELGKSLQAAGGPASNPTQIVATTDGKTDLASFVSRTRVLATAAGPFSIHGGEAMIKACASAGVHYVDVSDEFFWQREMTDRYDAVAHTKEVRIYFCTAPPKKDYWQAHPFVKLEHLLS